MTELLLNASVRRKILARMSLASVEKNRLDAFHSVFPCHGLQRRRRQRTVGSGERTKLNQQVTFLPVITQSNRPPGFQQGCLKVRRSRAYRKMRPERQELRTDEFAVVVLLDFHWTVHRLSPLDCFESRRSESVPPVSPGSSFRGTPKIPRFIMTRLP